MKHLTIPIEIPPEIAISLNGTEQELQMQFRQMIALALFKQKKLTFGQARNLAGLTRYEFEKALASQQIPLSATTIEEVKSDLDKLKHL